MSSGLVGLDFNFHLVVIQLHRRWRIFDRRIQHQPAERAVVDRNDKLLLYDEVPPAVAVLDDARGIGGKEEFVRRVVILVIGRELVGQLAALVRFLHHRR